MKEERIYFYIKKIKFSSVVKITLAWMFGKGVEWEANELVYNGKTLLAHKEE